MTRRRAAARWLLLGALVLAAILVPFFLFEDRIAAAAEALLRARHARWLVALAVAALLAADVVLPVPSSVVCTASGALLGLGPGAAATWSGMTLGCLGGYLLGQSAGAAAVRRLLGPAEEARMSRAALRHGPWLLAVFRAVPVLAEASVIFGGASRMPLRTFLPITALANLGVAAAYAAVGAYAKESTSFLLAFAGSIAVPALGLVVVRMLRA